MKRFGCVLLAAVMVLFMTGSALAEQKVQLPDSRYSLTLPDGLETVADYAFTDCSGFSGIRLSQGLKSIGREALTPWSDEIRNGHSSAPRA